MAQLVGETKNHRRFLQEKVRIDYRNGKTDKYFICRCETVKVTHKQDTDLLTASHETTPYAISFGGTTHEIQLSSIDPNQKRFFEFIFRKQEADISNPSTKMPKITLYKYASSDGSVLKEVQFPQVWIEEISKENGKPFDVKLGAVSATLEGA